MQTVMIRGKIIPYGYEWDGASIPRGLWSVLGYGKFHPKVMLASLLHDYYYDDPKVDQKWLDEAFADLLRDAGVPWWRIKLMYRAVRAWRIF